jgi:hypothetical protein
MQAPPQVAQCSLVVSGLDFVVEGSDAVAGAHRLPDKAYCHKGSTQKRPAGPSSKQVR